MVWGFEMGWRREEGAIFCYDVVAIERSGKQSLVKIPGAEGTLINNLLHSLVIV